MANSNRKDNPFLIDRIAQLANLSPEEKRILKDEYDRRSAENFAKLASNLMTAGFINYHVSKNNLKVPPGFSQSQSVQWLEGKFADLVLTIDSKTGHVGRDVYEYFDQQVSHLKKRLIDLF